MVLWGWQANRFIIAPVFLLASRQGPPKEPSQIEAILAREAEAEPCVCITSVEISSFTFPDQWPENCSLRLERRLQCWLRLPQSTPKAVGRSSLRSLARRPSRVPRKE